jgi:hypothetical protein
MRFEQLTVHREKFWGGKPPTAKVRREKIGRILKEAREEYFKRLESQGGAVKTNAKREDNLLFVIDKEEVCEKAYVNILGLASSKGDKSKMWNDEVSKFFGMYFIMYIILLLGY